MSTPSVRTAPAVLRAAGRQAVTDLRAGLAGKCASLLCTKFTGATKAAAMLMPACFIAGAVFMLAIDDLSRCISSAEVPLGILSALVGSPIFAFLLKKTQ